MNHFLHGMVRAVAEVFHLPGPVVEIGAYQVSGQESIADLRRHFPGRPYLGVDMRPGPGVDCVASVEALPFASGSVGTVLALSTFEHVQRFWKGFDEIRRVLRPDGAFLVACPFYFKIHQFPDDYWRFTPSALEFLLEKYPHKIVGWHGARKRPANVWALAFREDHPGIDAVQHEEYRRLLRLHAHEPSSWGRRLRYRLASALCGRGPFAPYLDHDHWGDRMPNIQFLTTRRPGGVSLFLRQWAVAAPVDLSVCIANWNCRELLRGCLESLREARGLRLEIIVVDNASTDGAADMVRDEFPEVQLIRNDANLGFARANNQAARRARGAYLFFLNNDTVVPPETLSELVAYLRKNPDVSMVGPLLRDGGGRVQASYRDKPTMGVFLHRTLLLRWTGLFRGEYRRFRRGGFDPRRPQAVEVLLGAAVMLPEPRFRRMGGWDEDFHFGGEDMEISLRAQRFGKVMYLPTVEIKHFGRASTKANIVFAGTRIAVGFAQFLRKSGYSGWQMVGYKLAVTLDAPLQIAVRSLQYVYRRGRGRKREAEKCLSVIRGLVPFLCRGLTSFWKA